MITYDREGLLSLIFLSWKQASHRVPKRWLVIIVLIIESQLFVLGKETQEFNQYPEYSVFLHSKTKKIPNLSICGPYSAS